MDFLTRIPPDWFLWSLRDRRASITYAGDTHRDRLYWIVELQHVNGGRLVAGTGDTPEEAFDKAISMVERVREIDETPGAIDPEDFM